jgi:hypothetical protein
VALPPLPNLAPIIKKLEFVASVAPAPTHRCWGSSPVLEEVQERGLRAGIRSMTAIKVAPAGRRASGGRPKVAGGAMESSTSRRRNRNRGSRRRVEVQPRQPSAGGGATEAAVGERRCDRSC